MPGPSMNIAVIGGGFVGVTTATVFAEQGHTVQLVEINENRREPLARGLLPFYEPGLAEAWSAQVGDRITVRKSIGELEAPDFVFLCVGTPSAPDGTCETGYVAAAAKDIAAAMPGWYTEPVIVVKSTVPPGTTRGAVAPALAASGAPGEAYGLAMNPEFLREGAALADARAPDRVVFGTADALAASRLMQLYATDAWPVISTSLETAEMVKYVSNAFLATKISFANEMANYAESVGTNIDDVMDAVGMDNRIGRAFLNAGCGYGGSCFPKDVAGLQADARSRGVESRILNAVEAINRTQPQRTVDALAQDLGGLEGKRVAILGLAFKPGTSDVRETRALPIALALLEAGATVIGHDPKAATEFDELGSGIIVTDDLAAALTDADGAIVQTEWPEYRELAINGLIGKMRSPVVYDARRHLDGAAMMQHGTHYRALGIGGQP